MHMSHPAQPWTLRAIGGMLCVTSFAAPTMAQRGDASARTIAIEQMGQGQSLRLSLLWGRITVVGTDRKDVRYRITRDHGAPGAKGVAPPDIRFSQRVDRLGAEIVVEPEDVTGFEAAVLEVEIPRSLPRLRVEMRRGGEISVARFDGDLTVTSENGSVHAVDLGGGALIETLNGEIVAGISHSDARRPVSLLARNGGLALTLAKGQGADLDIDTRSGSIVSNVRLQGATLQPQALERERYVPRQAAGPINGGGPLVRLMTINGDVKVEAQAP